MKHKQRIASLIITAATVLFAAGAYAETSVEIDSLNREYTVNGETTRFSGLVFEKDGELYVPADDILPALGYITGWDAENDALCFSDSSCTNKLYMETNRLLINGEEKEYPNISFVYKNASYMPIGILDELDADTRVEVSGAVRKFPMWYRDTLENTFIPDGQRVEENTIEEYGGYYYINDTQAFERTTITDEQAQAYADAVNAVADRAAEAGANTYCMLIPSWNEIYAPKEYTDDQLGAYKKAYALMNANVVPINVFDTFIDHADEKLYFRTDHHWTHRGAYYAYTAFTDCLGIGSRELGEFYDNVKPDFKGSFIDLMAGSAAAENMSAGESIERFVPLVRASGMAYFDMNMRKPIGAAPVVDTNASGYNAFLGGDSPLIRIRTGIGNGKSVAVLKESYGNALATWLVNNYEYVYVIDIRAFNEVGGGTEYFDIGEFCADNNINDLIVINYPVTVASSGLTEAIADFAR